MKFSMLILLSMACASWAQAATKVPQSFQGEYVGYDAYWAHPFSAKFRIAIRDGNLSMTSTNISQANGCDARVGRLLNESAEGSKIVLVFKLRKGSNCRIEDSKIRFVIDPSASGCSEWSAKIRGQFVAYQYSGGTRRNIPSTHRVHWGLVKQNACR